MITPTVGRVVLVQRLGKSLDEAHQVTDLTAPEPAFITCVHEDRIINVAGFTQTGDPFAANGIALLQDDDPKPEGETFAYWMPYQKGQAAKAATVQTTGISPVAPAAAPVVPAPATGV